jgi:nucleoside-diphosphate-sugar epimerase
MKVLVTGGAGFKGCVVTEALLRAGHQVTVFDLMRYGEGPAIGLQRLGAEVVRGDVTKPHQVAPQVAAHDAVIHLAAVVGFPLCDLDPLRAEVVNVGGTHNVAAALRPGQPLIYASTGSVYGRVDDICTEDQEPRPLTRYGRTKLEGERIARMAGGVALRFATVVGVSPCMRFDLMVNAFVYRAIHFGWLDLYQPGDRRSFVDVADAADAYVFTLEHYDEMSGEVFNVGNSDLNLTKQQVAETVGTHFPMHIELTIARPDPDQRDYNVAFERIEALGFRSTVGLDSTIAQVGSIAQLVDRAEDWRFVP